MSDKYKHVSKYNIGDKIHAKCHTVFDFSVEIEILGIGSFDLADRYESVFLKMYNSDTEAFRANKEQFVNWYFYICCVQNETETFREGDIIILNDNLIKDEGTYYLNNEISLYINLSYSSITTPFKTPEDLIENLTAFLESRQIDRKNIRIHEELSYQEKLDYELNEYRSIINSLKNLKSVEQLVDRLNSCFNTLVTRINSLIEKITNIINK